ncbi:transposase [Alienimonas californiensis]|uniref:Transposase IS200 like protein n=1 Tax=Alienimonas californiensis TaxID=2527989 RepID=A0A517PC29_9PLAN|nr:transposase [Alienimonas californiensis]QDT16930.1 Transposase IS200 like protein [Alienimonas californiensis]
MHGEPLALFLTWTTYGTHLPGDARGWSQRGQRGLPPHPQRERFAARRMAATPCVLNLAQRELVLETIRAHCRIRSWPLHAVAVRTNHVHVVLSAPQVDPPEVRRQLKASTARRLKEDQPRRDRWWTEGGDVQFLDTEADVADASEYVGTAQDRKGRDDAESAAEE